MGLGCQVTDDYTGVAGALTATHPGESAQSVGQSVLDLAAQNLSFPAIDANTLAASPSSTTSGMENGYWLATLMRDMRVSAYLEAPPATAWTCYQTGAPSWSLYVTNKQTYSDALSEVIVSSNQIQASSAAALTPDVIVDDMSSDCAIYGVADTGWTGGWRGPFSTRRPPPARRP